MKLYHILIFCLLLSTLSFSQEQKRRDPMEDSKIQQLEKIKLIEALDLSEESSIRFFARRNEFSKEVDQLEEKSDKLLVEMENTFKDSDKNKEAAQKKLLDDFIKTRTKIETQRSKFLASLTDILSTEQICKYVVFEKRFRDEIRRVLINKRKKPPLDWLRQKYPY